ncbi:TetR family transcriptional regulator [Chitinophaga niastensis]|uniref:TetR family transcriptional regulator n=1 Tax=Chitinophaga niastensis TaxID=536980 RepID=A0A2P8H8Y5_CHINA|nr:TetR/AcrR family transcriptional regulator [Chitinophaga niastensis]PSL42696.1 TetR family transcriptional regulator [Chitinophaga niastensis]
MIAKKEIVVDRRIQKTKKALTEALIDLILEKSYEKVTIQDIIDKANVGRSTFYIHYESKEQLLLDGHNNLNVKLFFDELDDAKGSEISFDNLFVHIAENQQLAKAMLGKKGGNMMTEFFKNNVALKIKKKFGRQFDKSKKEQKLLTFLADAAGAAVISFLVSWLEDEMPFTEKEISSRCQCLVTAIFERVSK